MQYIDKSAFDLEHFRRRSLTLADDIESAAGLRSVQGIAITVTPTVISHKGPVTITVTNDGSSSTKPSNSDWIACYSPANANFTTSTPLRYQFANWTGTWGTTNPATATLTFNLNNVHGDYACYFFTGGLKSIPVLPAPLDITYVDINNFGQNTGIASYAKPYVSMVGSQAKFKVLAGPSNTISFDVPNLPTHVRVMPGKDQQSFNFAWNQVSHHC